MGTRLRFFSCRVGSVIFREGEAWAAASLRGSVRLIAISSAVPMLPLFWPVRDTARNESQDTPDLPSLTNGALQIRRLSRLSRVMRFILILRQHSGSSHPEAIAGTREGSDSAM